MLLRLPVRLFNRAGNPQICGYLLQVFKRVVKFNVIYCGVPSIYMGFGRYYGLFHFVLTGHLLVGSNAIASSTPCLYMRGYLVGLGDSP